MGRKMNLLFTGDLCFSGRFKERLEQGESVFSSNIEELFLAQDHCIGNLEGPLVSIELQTVYQANIINPPACLPYLQSLNLGVFSLANNHSFDCGAEGFDLSRTQLDQQGVQWFGAGQNIEEASRIHILETRDQRVALIGLAFREGMLATKTQAGVYAPPSFYHLIRLIQAAKQQADKVILCYHGEEEYTRFPMPKRRKWLHLLAHSGVDAIVCHHPHVLQGIEHVAGVPICYSLGNTVFDVPGHRQRSYTEEGGLLLMTIEEGRIDIELVPIFLDRPAGMVRMLTSDSALEAIKRLNNFSSPKMSWQREAYRVFQERHILPDMLPNSSTSQNTLHPRASSSRWRMMIKKLSRFSFYQTLFATLRYRNSRTILFAAMIHQFRQRFPFL